MSLSILQSPLELLYLALHCPGEDTGQSVGVPTDGRHPFRMCEAADERLGKHLLQFDGIQGQLVLPRRLKGMEVWVIVPLYCKEKK